jgi:WD40 repeat protein
MGADTVLSFSNPSYSKENEAPLPTIAASPSRKRMRSVMKHCNGQLLTDEKPQKVSASAQSNFAHKAEVILDVPDIEDDYYRHTVDWSKGDWIAVATIDSAHLRHMGTQTVVTLANAYAHLGGYFSAIKFHPTEAWELAMGFEDGRLEVWDIDHRIPFWRNMRPTAWDKKDFVGGMSWKADGSILSVGYADGFIKHWDLRVRVPVATVKSHSGRIAGLAWDPSGKLIVSGSTDSGVKCWDMRADKHLELKSDPSLNLKPLWTIPNKTSTVKVTGTLSMVFFCLLTMCTGDSMVPMEV